MVLVQREIKAVYLWETQVRPTKTQLHTCTIVWNEVSDPASFFVEYKDDAAWLTPWDPAFDDFFWYSAVLLNTSWVETAEMKQSWWVFSWAMTTLGNIKSGDNVMIKFPVRWIKMTKSWSAVTLSITDELDKDGYQYYAFQTWTLSSPWTPKDAFYLWAYMWYNNSNVMKSWSGKTPTNNLTQANFCTYAKANWSWYNIEWFYQRMYIKALYMMKYGNPNSKTIIWLWRTNYSWIANTWGTDSQINATYWTSSNTNQIKLFWLEDFWGNLYDWVWGCYTDSSKVLYTRLTWWTWAISWWTSTWTTIGTTRSAYCLSSIAGNNKAMFCETDAIGGSPYNIYYSNYAYINTSALSYEWGYYGTDNNSQWVLYSSFNAWASEKDSSFWARLMYLNWLT